ncbi:GD14537 [Drosophila simulans]|uniref:GD14537 n=1 Tax=Drosophila simulans TaxID=7240 RepID=B4QL08_DROSI|nr:GD14537 [Drosophila simulans]
MQTATQFESPAYRGCQEPGALRPESQTETRPDPGEQPEPEPLPFKAKLEAILQRGPSHRTQQHPDLVRRQRPQSTYIEVEELES